MTRFAIEGRTAFITGAARGIGAATAERLHRRGANVALVGLEPERLAENAERLGADHATWFEADVTDFEALQRAVAGTVERFGGVDIAIANAGLAFMGTLATSPMEQVERTLAVNLLGVWRTDRAVIEQITARQGLSAEHRLDGSRPAHAADGPLHDHKGGCRGAQRRAAVETAPSGARVGCAYFGFIDTDLVRASYAQPSIGVDELAPAGVHARPDPAVARGRRDRAGHRATLGARVGTAQGGRRDRAAGLMQPLVERVTLRDQASLGEALRLAEPRNAATEDTLLGVSAQALEGRGEHARPRRIGASRRAPLRPRRRFALWCLGEVADDRRAP